MQRKFAFVFIISSFHLLCAALAVLIFSPQAQAASHKNEMVVVIDPGHGGEIPGARGRFAVEKDVVLQVSKKVGEAVVKAHPDVELIYTRSTDTAVSFDDRSSIANRLGADLFISIHANADKERTGMGTETWVMGLDKTEKNMEVAMMENAEVVYEDGYETKYEGFDPNSPESFIMFSFMQNTHMEQSLYFASLVENEFTTRDRRKSRGVKQGPFLVLWRTNMPSVLIEIGFISHREEEKYISSEHGQNEIAQAIAAAIGEYKSRWEKNRSASVDHSAAPLSAAKATETAARALGKPSGTVVKPSTSNIKPSGTKQPAKPVNRTTYHVQIFSTSRVLNDNSPEFRGLKDVEYYRMGAACRYYVGNCSSEREAGKILREVKNKFPDAFIIRLRNGKPE